MSNQVIESIRLGFRMWEIIRTDPGEKRRYDEAEGRISLPGDSSLDDLLEARCFALQHEMPVVQGPPELVKLEVD